MVAPPRRRTLARRYPPIAEYALIGDCHGAALVHARGSIDWACLRRFDAGAMFARLLDADNGGYFGLDARGLRRTARCYRGETMVLETTLITNTGEARIIDAFAMRRGGRHTPYKQLLRCVEGVRGKVTIDVCVQPRFDYGELRPWISFHGDETYVAIGGDDALILTSSVVLDPEGGDATLRGTCVVRAGERQRFSVRWRPAHDLEARPLSPREFDRRLAGTERWWSHWSKGTTYKGPYQKWVRRSGLVLKTLTTAPTGAIIAAPTTSLPEAIGGDRNWDYRFSWVRDSAFTVAALCNIGHYEAARGFRDFIFRATAGHADDMQIMYGCYGERRLTEIELPLEGYRGSRPVRVGNAAALQRQADIYGELLNASDLWQRQGNPVTRDEWRFLTSVVEAARTAWREPDRGIWEIRGEPKHFVHSKVMCWVAVDRGIRIAVKQNLPADLAAWRRSRRAIRHEIEKHGVDPTRNCFVQSFGSREVDASLLLLPIVGFVRVGDPRMLATVAQIEKNLLHDGMVRRYRPSEKVEHLTGHEGTFLMCSFWLADVLAMQGRTTEAKALFERLLRVGNDVGLFAEEYEPTRKVQLGNFPQAFTHVALINSAITLDRACGCGAGATFEHAVRLPAAPRPKRLRVARPRAR